MNNLGNARDFMTNKENAEIVDIKDNIHNNTNGLRLYPYHKELKDNDYTFALQIRTYKPITWLGKKPGKPRNMVATVRLTLGELKELVAIAESQILH